MHYRYMDYTNGYKFYPGHGSYSYKVNVSTDLKVPDLLSWCMYVSDAHNAWRVTYSQK